jgi:hypothetical protein
MKIYQQKQTHLLQMPGISLIFRIFPIFGKWGKKGRTP